MISTEAVSQSILKNYDFTNFGLSSSSDGLFAEGLKCNGITPTTNSALGWIQEGSICEDDTRTEIYFRYKNHFYDSVHDKGLGGILWPNSGFISGERAPDWAMDMGPADGQLYSFSQGRQYFYDALTKSTDAERKTNLARMFRTLGNVMHIVQDMAQPQHTRNDSHVLPKSLYEVYTNDHLGTLTYTGEPVPTFATAREYITDLAQFTNNNFVSADTNFDMAAYLGYNLPALGAAKDELVHTLPGISPEILAVCNASTPCVMTFYSTSQTVTNSHASALSILDQYLKLRQVSYTDPVTSNIYFKNRVFTLNKFTFDKAHPFLIPRATAYSAGILDYFFRGQIDMVSDPGNPGKYMIKNLGTENMVGDFALYYDATDGNRYPVPGAAWSNLTVSANSQANNLSFAWPDNPAPQTLGEFTLVFSGTMGTEKRGVSSTGGAGNTIGAIVSKRVQLQCRTLSIVVSQKQAFSPVNPYVASDPNDPNAWAIKYPPATSVTSDTFIVGSTWPWGAPAVNGPGSGGGSKITVTNSKAVSYVVPAPPSAFSLFSGSWWSIWVVPGATDAHFIDGAWTDYLPSAQASADVENIKRLAEVNTGCSTNVTLTDGTQLASIPFTILDGVGHKANYPISTTWSGSNWLDLYTDTNDGNGNWTPIFSQRVTFSIPQGVCNP